MSSLFMETEESDAAAEGTLAHSVAEEMIRSFQQQRDPVYPEGASTDMIDAARIYAEDVINTMNETQIFGGNHCLTEAKLKMPQVHEACFGTCDQFLFSYRDGILYVWDFKHGFSPVSPKENWQLILYAAGIFKALGIHGDRDQYITVVFKIVQPRAFGKPPIQEWRVLASDLRPYIVKASNAAQWNLAPEATCTSGAHCKHCPAIHACPAALAEGVGLFSMLDKPIPLDLSGEELGSLLNYLDRATTHIGQLKEAIEAQAKSTIQAGKPVSGYTLQKAYGRKKWNLPAEDILVLGESFGINLSKPDVITPAQAIKAGLDSEIVDLHSDRPSTGFKLVKANSVIDAFKQGE